MYKVFNNSDLFSKQHIEGWGWGGGVMSEKLPLKMQHKKGTP
jgi:hypothetical protein